MSSNIKLNNLIKALRMSVRSNIKQLEVTMRKDLNKYIKGGRVDMDVDTDRSVLATIDELVQVDTAMASNAMAEVEKFSGASIALLRSEEEGDLNEDQWRACQVLATMESHARKDEKVRLFENRKSILDSVDEDFMELDIQLAEQADSRNDDERTYDSLVGSWYKSQNKRGYDFIMWFRANADKMSRDQIIDWSKKLNKRRFSASDNKLSYVLWVAGKLIVEKQLSIKGITTKEKAKASVEFAKRLKEWNDNNLQERFVSHNEQPLADWQMDVENPLAGRASLNYKKFEEYCDISNTFGDRYVAMGFMMSNEEEYEIKDGTDRLSDILLALVKACGNKSAAAILCGLPRSTYRNRLNKALKVVNDRLDEGKISKEEHQLVVNLL
jgi:hypothetical protein